MAGKKNQLEFNLFPAIIDSPECGAVALGDILTVIDSLVVVLYHHLLSAVLQVLGFHLHIKADMKEKDKAMGSQI